MFEGTYVTQTNRQQKESQLFVSVLIITTQFFLHYIIKVYIYI